MVIHLDHHCLDMRAIDKMLIMSSDQSPSLESPLAGGRLEAGWRRRELAQSGELKLEMGAISPKRPIAIFSLTFAIFSRTFAIFPLTFAIFPWTFAIFSRTNHTFCAQQKSHRHTRELR